MAFIDYYKILGISNTATEKEIKSAYRKLARKFHPDVNPDNKEAEIKFKEINEANEVLSNPENRKKYDKYGKDWKHGEEYEKAHFYKMSLGNTQDESDNEIYEYCIENNCISIGFGNQFDFTGYSPQLPNNEPIQVINANFVDINSGILYNSVGEEESFTAGFSMYNINQSSKDPLKLATREGLTFNYQLGYSKVLSDYSQVFFGGLHSVRATQSSTSLVGAIQILPDYDNYIGFDVGGVYVLNNSISPFVN